MSATPWQRWPTTPTRVARKQTGHDSVTRPGPSRSSFLSDRGLTPRAHEARTRGSTHAPARRLLFITWDGPGSNYHESLFLPILERTGLANHNFHIMQFSWGAEDRTRSIARACARREMPYTVIPVWRAPPRIGTAAAIAAGIGTVARYTLAHKIDVLMPRSIIPAAMALSARRLLPAHTALLYDADGLMADERVDFSGWKEQGPQYRLLRAIEKQTVTRASAVIVRSQQASATLAERATVTDKRHFFVVTNGSDPDLFQPGTPETRTATRLALGIKTGAPTLLYSGSLGGKYDLSSMLRFATSFHRIRSDSVFIILTPTPDLAHQAITHSPFPRERLRILAVEPHRVPEYLAAADIGLALIKPTYSMKAVSPIKVGEYLLSGLPVLYARNVGDLDTQLDASVGYGVLDTTHHSLASAATWFADTITTDREQFRTSCRECGLRHFNIGDTAAQYQRAITTVSERL